MRTILAKIDAHENADWLQFGNILLDPRSLTVLYSWYGPIVSSRNGCRDYSGKIGDACLNSTESSTNIDVGARLQVDSPVVGRVVGR